MAANLDEQRTDPESIAERALERWNNPYPKGDVRYVPTFDEEQAEVDAATLDQVKAFYARFVGGAHAELAVVGDFDPAEAMRALATEFFGAWTSPAAVRARTQSVSATGSPPCSRRTTPDKANATLFGRLPLQLNDHSPDLPALMVVDKILGASPESRIPDRVREREGLSYSIQTWLSRFELRGEYADVPVRDLRARKPRARHRRHRRGDRPRAEGRIHRGRGRERESARCSRRGGLGRAQDGALANALAPRRISGARGTSPRRSTPGSKR